MKNFLNVASLVTAAALNDDETAVRLLLHGLPPEQTAAACEGAVLAMAGLVREAITPEAVEEAVRQAQALALEAVTEGEPR